jgi:hypothetical protein
MSKPRKKGKKKSIKPPFTIFNPHSSKACIEDKDKNIYIATIDPGTRNFAIRVACYVHTTAKSVTCLLENIDLLTIPISEDCKDERCYSRLIKVIREKMPFLSKCHYIGIERQLPLNDKMYKFGQCLIGILMTIVTDVGNKPLIIELDSKLKTGMLNAPLKMDKPARKKWAHKYGAELLRSDGETQWADYILSISKGDDLGDVICYEKCILLLLYNGKIPAPIKI